MKVLPKFSLSISVALCVFLIICYTYRFDTCSAITIFPVWFWILPGFIITGIGFINIKKRYVILVVMLWVLFVVLFADETKGMVRVFFKPTGQENSLRIVSLNCNGGSYKAASEVIGYDPDIVLLQETPSRKEVMQLTKKLFGEEGAFVWGVDNTIIVKGSIRSASENEKKLQPYSVQAHVQLCSGIRLEVVSLRLNPPSIRLDIWSTDCWKSHMRERRKKRSQISEIKEELNSISSEIPILIGGDFNAPAGDAIFFILQPRFHDVFVEGGRGWGNTIMNDIPVHRYDQIWASKHFKAYNVNARKTQHSDHRIVIADLMLK